MARKYSKTVRLNGDGQKALEFAAAALTLDNFKITRKTHDRLEAVGTLAWYYPRVKFGSYTNQPYYGLRSMEFRLRPRALAVDADLGNLTAMMASMAVMIFLLGVGLAVVFTFTFGSPARAILHAFLPLAPWPVLLPLIGLFMRRQVQKKVDALLENAVQAAAQQ